MAFETTIDFVIGDLDLAHGTLRKLQERYPNDELVKEALGFVEEGKKSARSVREHLTLSIDRLQKIILPESVENN